MTAVNLVLFGRFFNLINDSYICSNVPSKTLPHPAANNVSPQKRIGSPLFSE